MSKIFSRGLLAFYLVILIWIVLGKASFNISSVLEFQNRSINLIPFAAPIPPYTLNLRETIYNCVFFIPFGLLLSVNFKNISFWRKLAFILVLSLIFEIIQYIFAIGTSDITDLITNTLGGFLGLKLYDLGSKYLNNEKLDRVIIAVSILLLILFTSMIAIILVRRF